MMAALAAIALAALLAAALVGHGMVARRRRIMMARDPLAYPHGDAPIIAGFKCNNWAGDCQVPCGRCGDWS